LTIPTFTVALKREAGYGHTEDRKNRVPLAIEFIMEDSTYERLMAFSQASSLTIVEAVMSAIEKGMENYWLMAYKSLKQDYSRLSENHERCRKDNKLLSTLEKQNEELEELLRSKGMGKEMQRR